MSEILEKIKEKFSEYYRDSHSKLGENTVLIKREGLLEVMEYLKEKENFNVLMDLTCVDYYGEEERFEVVYHLYGLEEKKRLRVKVRVSEEDPQVDSLTKLWKSADWYEREVWDMFGVKFKNHPNLKRILMYDEFEGHPLRKDYPLRKRQPRVGPLN